MPKPTPKHRKDLDDPTRPLVKYHNRRRIKRVIIAASLLAVAAGFIAWSLVTTFPDTRPGDTVRIKYEIWAEGGTYIEGSSDITVYIDLNYSPKILYYQMAHAKIGIPRQFSVAACPTHDCANFEGFTTGTHAWQGIYGNVTVLEILAHS